MENKNREGVCFHAEGISKIYPGTKALDNVDFDLLTGKVNVLIGENGAGKSTLMKMIAGIEQPSEGKLYMDGKEVHFRNTTEARSHGIGIIHQELNLFPNLPVYQNIFVAREKKKGFGMDNKYHREKAAEVLKKLEHEIPVDTLVGELRVGQQQMIEIARKLLAGADGEGHPPERGLYRPHGAEQDRQCVLQGPQAGGQAGERVDTSGGDT